MEDDDDWGFGGDDFGFDDIKAKKKKMMMKALSLLFGGMD